MTINSFSIIRGFRVNTNDLLIYLYKKGLVDDQCLLKNFCLGSVGWKCGLSIQKKLELLEKKIALGQKKKLEKKIQKLHKKIQELHKKIQKLNEMTPEDEPKTKEELDQEREELGMHLRELKINLSMLDDSIENYSQLKQYLEVLSKSGMDDAVLFGTGKFEADSDVTDALHYLEECEIENIMELSFPKAVEDWVHRIPGHLEDSEGDDLNMVLIGQKLCEFDLESTTLGKAALHSEKLVFDPASVPEVLREFKDWSQAETIILADDCACCS